MSVPDSMSLEERLSWAASNAPVAADGLRVAYLTAGDIRTLQGALRLARDVEYFGPALEAREYERNSYTIRAMVADASRIMAAARAPREGR